MTFVDSYVLQRHLGDPVGTDEIGGVWYEVSTKRLTLKLYLNTFERHSICELYCDEEPVLTLNLAGIEGLAIEYVPRVSTTLVISPPPTIDQLIRNGNRIACKVFVQIIPVIKIGFDLQSPFLYKTD